MNNALKKLFTFSLKNKGSQSLFETLIQVNILFFLLFYYKLSLVFGNGPATGGDTGSHFWPLYFMKKMAWEQGHFDFRFWNPGNYYGEPLLIHYFPLPFILMALCSYFLSLPDSFNLITLIGPLTLPLCVYISCKILKLKSPYASIISLFSLIFLFDDTWSIYGGNISSTLAGQFAHSISLNLFIIGVSLAIKSFIRKEISYSSIILFALVGLTHAYTFLAIPIFYFIYLLGFERTKKNFWQLTFSGLLTLALVAWFVFPMIDNQSYNTYYSFQSSWSYIGRVLKSYFLIIPSVLSLIPFIYFFTQKNEISQEIKLLFYSYFGLSIFYTLMYFVFPHIGLVDGRSIPHTYLYLFICFGISISYLCTKFLNSTQTHIFVFVLTAITFTSIYKYSTTVPHWIRWNYSGWQKKPLSKDFKNLTRFLKGDLSDPRIAYENHSKTNSAGTIRAFEMLPFFSNRSTTEGVYHQSTIVNNASFHLQSLISQSPSCPFYERFPCGSINYKNISDKMNLLGVNQLIVISKKSKEAARKSDEITFQKSFGPWSVFKSKLKPKLVEVIQKPLQFIETKNWRQDFYQWFKAYTFDSNYLIHLENGQSLSPGKIKPTNLCKPKVKLLYNGFELETNCLNFPHIVKFAYHSSWRSDSNLEMYKISPGFILTYPNKSKTVFKFAQTPWWKWMNALSLFSFIFLCFLRYRKYR